MVLLAKVISMGVVVYLIKVFLWPFIKPVSGRQKKKAGLYINDRKKELRNKRIDEIKKQIARKYGKYLMSSGERTKIAKLLYRLDMDILPEEIRIKQITYALVALAVAIILMSINEIIGYIALLFVFLMWLMPVDELEKKLDKKNKNIARDFPAFYSMVYYQYSKTVNIYLSDVIKDYLPNAGKDLAGELSAMLDNIEYGEAYALKQLKKKVPIHFVIKFCDVMETRLKGYDNTSQMAYLKNEIDQFRVNALEKELEKREAENARVQMTLIIILIAYVVMYFLFNTLSALKMFQ